MTDASLVDDPAWCPKAADGLEIHEADDGCIVFQSDRERVHHLNRTAAILLALCTGRLRGAEMPGLLQSAFRLAAPPAAETRACLAQLVAEKLVV
jgi:hypothetical protein